MRSAATKTISCLAAIILLLSGCGYRSHYRTVACVRTNTAQSAALSFYELEGVMVFKMKQKTQSEGEIRYSAQLETGTATVYYDYMGVKTELFTVCGGETLDDHGGYIEKGTVYIIVETDGVCENGAFRFEVG
ncbi:MAG: hypothetical protein IJT27_05930 [Clostridia bacterium]|nr:hypothetical protein [Clostridia bacterium]